MIHSVCIFLFQRNINWAVVEIKMEGNWSQRKQDHGEEKRPKNGTLRHSADDSHWGGLSGSNANTKPSLCKVGPELFQSTALNVHPVLQTSQENLMVTVWKAVVRSNRSKTTRHLRTWWLRRKSLKTLTSGKPIWKLKSKQRVATRWWTTNIWGFSGFRIEHINVCFMILSQSEWASCHYMWK